MNYIKHLTRFFELVANDDRLNPNHISLYMALFQFWNLNRFINPISVNRSEMMKISKIGSMHTYHKCLHDLHNWKFIVYQPSHNPAKGSIVNLFIFETSRAQVLHKYSGKSETSPEQVLANYSGKNGTSSEQVLPRYINNINITNNKTEREVKKIKNNFKKIIFPSLDDVKIFFNSEKFPLVEADKFFNHFESNGWKVGGKAPMKNWHAAARKWMMNTGAFSKSTSAKKNTDDATNKINLKTQKDYGEPL